MRRRGPRKTAGAFPRCLDLARGARITDIAGHEYVDFCLGDTGAMAGHSPAPVAEAVARRYAELGGATAMLPTEDAEWAGAERTRRFGLARWSFSQPARCSSTTRRTPSPQDPAAAPPPGTWSPTC
ncbi:hypothetical protein [Streptomyces sp. NPDC087437]|uniref:hypothetical protein n=1 Tax=Streptomyces sp. NPDC087437 TaxID=3365789 RepID=UPI00381284E9